MAFFLRTFVVIDMVRSAARQPLPLTLSPLAGLAWLALVLLAATIASVHPARSAMRLTVGKAFAVT